jgi:hypothetical protein
VLVLEHQKGTSSVRKQEPIMLVRCGTPYGAVLQLPEHVAADPEQAAAHARRLERQQRHKEGFAVLCDLVAELHAGGEVSKNKLRSHHKHLSIPKNDVDALVDRAIAAGVLRPGRCDARGRILDLELGARPAASSPAQGGGFDARATAGDPEHGRGDL